MPHPVVTLVERGRPVARPVVLCSACGVRLGVLDADGAVAVARAWLGHRCVEPAP